MAGYFTCRTCLTQDSLGNCTSDAYLCVTMIKADPVCSGYQPLCNTGSGAYVAATTVCQQKLFSGKESTTVANKYTIVDGVSTATVSGPGSLSPFNGLEIIAACPSTADVVQSQQATY